MEYLTPIRITGLGSSTSRQTLRSKSYNRDKSLFESYMSNTDGNTQMGLFTENGSGGFMSDCFISGGAYGICKYNANSDM